MSAYPFAGITAAPYENVLAHVSDIAALIRFAAANPPGDAVANGFAYVSACEDKTAEAASDAAQSAPTGTQPVPELPLLYIRRRFGLNDFEYLCLLTATASAWDGLGDDAYTFRMAADIKALCDAGGSDTVEASEALAFFLRAHGPLSYLLAAGSNAEPSAGLSGRIVLRPEAFCFITDRPFDTGSYLTLYSDASTLIPLYPEERAQAIRFIKAKTASGEDSRLLVVLNAKRGTGRRSLARQISADLDNSLLVVAPTDGMDDDALRELNGRAVCLCLLTGALLAVTADDSLEKAIQCIQSLPGCVRLAFMISDGASPPVCGGFDTLTVPLSALPRKRRMDLWAHFGEGLLLDTPLLADRYHVTAGQVAAVTAAVKNQKLSLDQADAPDDMLLISRETGRRNKGSDFTRIVYPAFTLNDLVVDAETRRQLDEIGTAMRCRPRLFELYGYGGLFPYGRGLGVLFYGPPGTGKTMAVQALARELGLDVMTADISRIIDKYIGETEKNLSEVFAKARENNCVLFFDEADSLFSKRTDVGDAHDRHANAQTAHLLQKMEDYDGLVILATNLLENVDDAFKRRLPFIVHFAGPDATLRTALWERFVPEAMPHGELDYTYLGDHFDLTPAVIKWAALSAGVRALAENTVLSMSHILNALRYEYHKMGIAFPEKPPNQILL